MRAADRGRQTLFIAPTPSLCLFASASLRKQGNLAACAKDADGSGYGDVLMCVGEQSGVGVNGKHLYFVAVATGAEQKLSVGRDGEISRVDGCRLSADAGNLSGGFIH